MVFFSHTIFRIPSLFLYALGKNKQYSIFSIFDALLNVTLSLIFVKYLDIKGIVLATIIATSLTSVPSNLYFFNKFFNTKGVKAIFIRPILLPVLIVSPMLLFSYHSSTYILNNISNWLDFSIIVIIFNVLYIPVLIIINYKSIKKFKTELTIINNGIYRGKIASRT